MLRTRDHDRFAKTCELLSDVDNFSEVGNRIVRLRVVIILFVQLRALLARRPRPCIPYLGMFLVWIADNAMAIGNNVPTDGSGIYSHCAHGRGARRQGALATCCY